MALQDNEGRPIPKEQWEENYRRACGENPSPRRYSILRRLLEIKQGDVVGMPKMPNSGEFSIACVSGSYTFSVDRDDDYGHIIPVHSDSVRTFNHRADEDAYAVSSLFSSPAHRSPVTFTSKERIIEAARNLLERESIRSARDPSSLAQASLDDALKKAAEVMLRKESPTWSGDRFEKIVKQAFKNRGYEIVTEKYRRYDGSGSDVDIIVRPPSNIDSLFMPQEIAVQVKWKQCIDENDVSAVNQLVSWNEVPIEKMVISSADDFTDECKRVAKDNDIILLGGLNTMYFLMGLPNPFREE